MYKRIVAGKILLFFLLHTASAQYDIPPEITTGKYIGAFDVQVFNQYAKENVFRKKMPDFTQPPAFNGIKNKLPQPFWSHNPEAIKVYWKTWELAFNHLEPATKNNGYVSPYIDPHFNGCIFLWDDCFMTMFGKYGVRAFHFQGSLDNFYTKQDSDGYICRQIINETGNPSFEKNNLASTGPNIFSWAEWEYYLNFHDKKRLAEVFPVLLAYHQWTRSNRSWQDGSYFSCGWGCGMDNQARLEPGYNVWFEHGFMSWIDISLQAILSGKILLKMAKELNRENDIVDVKQEISALTNLINTSMWDDSTAFYYDKQRSGEITKVMSIAGYWALLADIVPPEKLELFVKHLSNKNEFNREIRVPSLSASDAHYDPLGGYWNGSVWAPTTYMVLRGLTQCGQDSLAYEIGKNFHQGVTNVFTQTQTLFENYAPDSIKGNDRKDFVGWTGLVPISILFEYVMGIRPNTPENTLIIDVRMLDDYGINNYPFGLDGVLNIHVNKRNTLNEKPKVNIQSNVNIKIVLKWQGGKDEFFVTKNM